MKKAILISIVSIFMSSCVINSQMSNHPSVKKCGKKSYKSSQNHLSSQFGGSNFNGPNKFKKSHF